MKDNTTKAVAVAGNLADGAVSLNPEANLQKYLAEIRKFPMLTAHDEYALAKRWQDDGDEEAAHSLVTSHLRLVAKIAMKYRGYGLPLGELISEGNVGMMQAVKKFEPDRGFRLATYAMWWIKATINEYVLQSWSLVKIGTTAAQKKLFFNLRKMKSRLNAWDEGRLSQEHVHEIAEALDVTEAEVEMMDARIGYGGDTSLNSPVGGAGGDSDSITEWQDWLEDETMNQEQAMLEKDEAEHRHEMLIKAMEKLDERERTIIEQRSLTSEPKTLEALSRDMNVTRERVRQIEAKALAKLQKIMTGRKPILSA